MQVARAVGCHPQRPRLLLPPTKPPAARPLTGSTPAGCTAAARSASARPCSRSRSSTRARLTWTGTRESTQSSRRARGNASLAAVCIPCPLGASREFSGRGQRKRLKRSAAHPALALSQPIQNPLKTNHRSRRSGTKPFAACLRALASAIGRGASEASCWPRRRAPRPTPLQATASAGSAPRRHASDGLCRGMTFLTTCWAVRP